MHLCFVFLEVSGLNLCPKAILTVVFVVLHNSAGKCRYSTLKQAMLPFRVCPVHYFLIIALFEAICSGLHTAPLNKAHRPSRWIPTNRNFSRPHESIEPSPFFRCLLQVMWESERSEKSLGCYFHLNGRPSFTSCLPLWRQIQWLPVSLLFSKR